VNDSRRGDIAPGTVIMPSQNITRSKRLIPTLVVDCQSLRGDVKVTATVDVIRKSALVRMRTMPMRIDMWPYEHVRIA